MLWLLFVLLQGSLVGTEILLIPTAREHRYKLILSKFMIWELTLPVV